MAPPSKQQAVKGGIYTSEYEQAQKNGRWAVVGMVLGGIVAIGSLALEGLGADSTIGIIVGGAVSAAGMAQQALVNLGYIQGRSQVKQAASLEDRYPQSVKPESEES